MEKYFGEKQERFSFRKLSVGLVSATISSLFFMSVLASSSVDAQETAGVHYKYVADSELSSEEKKQLVYDIPTYVENDDETYYLVYKLNSQNQLAELPNTGSKNERQALVAGASLAALGILIFAVSKKKVKNKTVLHLVLVAGMGNGVLVSVHALENHLLLNYNTDYELTSGEKLPLPKEISGYTYIGYIKEGKTTSDFEVSNQEKSAATPTKQQKVDYNVTPNFVDHPSTVQAIQEQTPVSSTKPTEVQVVEKPFSTELINPRKEEKQSSDSQEQLAEHKNLETKKEEKISPKEKTGVNTLNPQDEVLSGQLNKPELLYHEETIETKIDFQEEIQENPDLAEGTVRVKQEGKLGKKVEIVRIFSVNKEEVSREIVSTSTTAPSPRIVEKGTKKTQVIKEQPETGVEHKDVQSGAIVEPAIQPELPEAVVSDKGEPEVQPTLPEAVVTDKGETEVQPESPDTVVSDKGEPEQVAPLPKYKGNIEQVKPETPVEKTKEQGPEKTEEVPVKPTEETPVNPNEGTTEGTSIQETENPVQPAEESTTNSEKVSPDTSSENTGEVSSNPSDSTTSVGESNKPENNDSKNENSEKTGEEVPVNPNEGTVEGTSNQETENPVQPAEESTTNSEKVSPDTSSENTGEVSSNPSDSTTSVGESNKPEKNGTATKPENSGNTTSENGQTEPEPSNGNSTEDVSTESNTSNSNGNEEIKQENELDPDKKVEEPEKTLELRNVSDLELYSLSNGTYKQHISLEQVPSNPNSYFVKVKSSSFKDVYLPVASISEERKNDKILYKITAYDRITSATWKYRNMVLPLLTLPERSVFVISTMSSLGFGAYDRYRSSDHKAGKALNDFVEENARETAKRQRDHYDYWYRILDDNAREKLYRNILLYDAYKFGDDNTVGKATEVADFDNPNPAMQHFFGPVGNKVGHNQHGAYATGDAVYYMGYRMLDKDGAITYTHEMTHDSDQDIYLGGYGRRSGLGPEFFAKGLLQAPDHPDDATITINSILKHSKSDSTESRRLQVLDPTTRFNNADDLKQYVHNMFDVVYMLEYLEGNSILKLDTNQKQQLLRKVTNEYHPDPDGNKVYATNVVRNLTVEEVERLRSFNDLIDNNILSSREYASGKYERNGYFTIKLFAPIYAALSNDIGTPGDLMGRRIAYELLAAKGFKDGMVPYISNQYEEEAKQKGKTINLYGKTRGLVTDDLVLEKVFNNQYHTWSEFKKAMYQERQDQFDRLNKVTFNDTTQPWQTFAKKTTSSVDELQKLMDVAVRKDAEHNYYHWNNYNPDIDSEVHKLKRAIFKAYLDQTNDFRSSIFENKK
ncbi:TPA: G5 domain-containing protein [Streptococcus pneumoniae]|nr:G5 domain-containing protein [Streptococcus pneumoniae]